MTSKIQSTTCIMKTQNYILAFKMNKINLYSNYFIKSIYFHSINELNDKISEIAKRIASSLPSNAPRKKKKAKKLSGTTPLMNLQPGPSGFMLSGDNSAPTLGNLPPEAIPHIKSQTEGHSKISAEVLIESSKEEIATKLAEMGYDVLRVSNSGDNVLHLATKKGNLEAIELAIAYGINVSRTNKAGDTPLHLAASKGQLEICQYLVDAGSDINHTNALGQTPYHKALKQPFPELLSFFKEVGYRPNDAFIDYLVAHDLTPNSVDNSGNQLMHRIVKTKNLELARNALENGFDPNIYNKKGESPLTLALKNQDLEMVQLLLEHQAVPLRTDIFVVVQANWMDALKALEQKWIDPITWLCSDYSNEKGIYLIHYACAKGNLEMINYLIEHGARVNQCTESQYVYGPRDPIHWSQADWDAWYELSNSGDLSKYTEGSGYVHPKVSPLAVVEYFHPERTDLKEQLIDKGAKSVHYSSVKNEEVENYLK